MLLEIKQKLISLQKLASEASFLVAYDQRSCNLQIKDLQASIRLLVPKKSRFAFAKISKEPTPKPQSVVDALPIIENVQDVFASTALKITNQRNKVLIPSNKTSDLEISNIEQCILILNTLPTSIFLKNIKDSVIIIGKTSGSLFCEGLEHCMVTADCKQLRIHKSSNVNWYVKVKSTAIIEDCTGMGFAAYPFVQLDDSSPKGNDMLVKLKEEDILLAEPTLVDDFHWHKRIVSPNWYVIPHDSYAPITWPTNLVAGSESVPLLKHLLK